MRFLVLGAGALGGMLLKGGADLSFLVRPKRVAQLAEQGLIVKAPGGDIKRPVKAMLSGEIGRGGNLGRRCSGQHSNRRYRHKRVTLAHISAMIRSLTVLGTPPASNVRWIPSQRAERSPVSSAKEIGSGFSERAPSPYPASLGATLPPRVAFGEE
jgi:hypothetical protein